MTIFRTMLERGRRGARRSLSGSLTVVLSMTGPLLLPAPVGAAPAASIVLSPNTLLGTHVYVDTQGLSFEVLDMTLPQFTSGNLSQLLKTLGSGVMRIGGNSADQTFWTSKAEPSPAWATGRIVPDAFARLAGLARASGWRVVLAVNLKHFDPARAADEVASAQSALGGSLQAVEIGNEPNFYYTDYARYWNDFEAYRQAIRSRAPLVAVVGADADASGTAFQSAFVLHEQSQRDIVALTRHFYSLSACGGNVPTISQLLSSGTYTNQKAAGSALASQARSLNLPGWLDETNSVVCQGQPGVSDVFASSLWAFRHALVVPREGVRRLDFHGTVRTCGGPKPNFMYYTPFCAPSAQAPGSLVAQPEYYGLLAFRAMGSGDYISVDNPAWERLHVHAIKNGSTVKIALVNVQDPAISTATPVTIAAGATYAHATRLDLKTIASSGLTAKTGITIGAQSVRADGTLPGFVTTDVPIAGRTLKLDVSAGSATIVTLS